MINKKIFLKNLEFSKECLILHPQTEYKQCLI